MVSASRWSRHGNAPHLRAPPPPPAIYSMVIPGSALAGWRVARLEAASTTLGLSTTLKGKDRSRPLLAPAAGRAAVRNSAACLPELPPSEETASVPLQYARLHIGRGIVNAAPFEVGNRSSGIRRYCTRFATTTALARPRWPFCRRGRRSLSSSILSRSTHADAAREAVPNSRLHLAAPRPVRHRRCPSGAQ